MTTAAAASGRRPRGAERRCSLRNWSATLTYSFQRQNTRTARGTRSRPWLRAPSSGSGQSSTISRPRRWIFTWMGMSALAISCLPAPGGHSPGVSGTSTRNMSRITTRARAPVPDTQARRRVLPAWVTRTTVAARSPGCKVPTQFYSYVTNPVQLSERTAALVQARRPVSLAGRPVLAKVGRQKLRRHLLHARTAVQGRRVPFYLNYYHFTSADAAGGTMVCVQRELRGTANL